MNNKFCYEIKNGKCSGHFNIYQAKNGSIQLVMGNCYTTLTSQQVLALNLDLFSLIDYDHDKYIEFYKEEKRKFLKKIRGMND